MPGLGLSLRLGRTKGSVGSELPQDEAITTLLSQAANDGADPASGGTLTALNILVTNLKANGIWNKLDLFYVFATNGDQEFARYNIIAPASFKCTETGAGALTFTSNEGFETDGVNYLDTNYNPSTNGVNYTLNSASYGVYSRVSVDNMRDMGLETSTATFLHARPNVNVPYRINAASNTNSILAADARGFWHVNRSGATSHNLFKDGATLNNGSIASSSVISENFTVLKTYQNIAPSGAAISIAFVGGDLSSEASDFYNAINTYMTSIGTAV